MVVPLGATAATFSAYGLATSDVVLSAELSDPANYPVDPSNVQSSFDTLQDDLRARMDAQHL
ncbi:hypothetical protein Q8G47_29630, partial [Klebsiella pneumoniae]|uniref:hypothetical protein n=1 Tax=Klebsiella pneumoniae TaxID=573 RepID=UPI00301376BA